MFCLLSQVVVDRSSPGACGRSLGIRLRCSIRSSALLGIFCECLYRFPIYHQSSSCLNLTYSYFHLADLSLRPQSTSPHRTSPQSLRCSGLIRINATLACYTFAVGPLPLLVNSRPRRTVYLVSYFLSLIPSCSRQTQSLVGERPMQLKS